MGNSLIVMKDGGDVQGEILDNVFNFQSGAMGIVSNAKDQVAQINIALYRGDKPDRMILTDQSEYCGRFMNPSVTIKVSLSKQIKSIQSSLIKTVMIHFNIDS